MPSRGLTRGAVVKGKATPTHAPIYVDSDDNILKYIPAGSGTTEVQVLDASATQTLTNKTLTSPTINTPTITAPVITGVGSYVQPSVVQAILITLTAAESGRTYYLDAAAEFAVTLPAAALGLKFTFIVKAAPATASYTIVTPGAAELIFGKILSAAGDAGDVENTGGGTTITFVDGQAVIGDRVDMECDGTNWYVVGFASVAAGITITG